MEILVTGGSGSVGHPAVAWLVEQGHHVRVIGRSAGAAFDGPAAHAEYGQCDVTDFAALQEQMRGMEAVVHLAAIPSPRMAPGPELFRVNCKGTFNVYEAAAQAGIRRVVSASSIQALGYVSGIKTFDLDYFPVDEAHPVFTTDPYGFSKQVLEEIGAYYWRREGISGVCLRLPDVLEGERAEPERLRRRAEWMQEVMAELLRLPEGERRERVGRIIEADRAFRTERLSERSYGGRRRGWSDDLRIANAAKNFWATLDARDSAQAIEKGLLAEYEGCHPLFVVDPHNSAGVEAELLLGTFFPGVKERKRALVGTASLVSSDRARELIGFEAEYSVSRVLASA